MCNCMCVLSYDMYVHIIYVYRYVIIKNFCLLYNTNRSQLPKGWPVDRKNGK